MKNFKNRIIAICIMGLALSLSSCLEDTGYLNIYNKENNGPVLSFGQADHGKVVRTVEVQDALQDVTVVLNVARATSDVQATVSVDAAALDAYNATDPAGGPYSILPDSTYDIPATTVTISKGTLDLPFVIKLNSSKIDLSEAYILPLVITGTSDGVVIASNLNTSYVAVVVKNKYDGLYTVTGPEWTDNVLPNLHAYLPWKAALVTQGAREVLLNDAEGYFSDPRIHIIRDGATTISGYGQYAPIFEFDENDDVIGVINAYGQPSGNTRSAELDPTGVNHYDAATKVLRVKYHMIQTNQPTGTSPRVTFDEVWTYTGPRP